METIKFYISCAGVAGDPNKLLVAVDPSGNIYYHMFNDNSNISLWLAKRRLIKRIKLLRDVEI